MSKKTQHKQAIEQALNEHKLVLASNRGPIQFEIDKSGKRHWRRGAGGLITALHSVLTTTKALWVAAAMTDGDRQVAQSKQVMGLPEADPLYWTYLVDIPPDTYDLYYNHFSNKIFWFLQHYLFDSLNQPVFDEKTREAWQKGYVVTNRMFAEVIVDIIRNDDEPVILIQDYHLYLVAGFLRRLRPDSILFHFIHIPWCSSDYFRFLPTDIRQKILESLLANDIIGFHSWRYVRNFMLCCQDFLSCRIDLRRHKVFYRDRVVSVKAYPISINVEELLATLKEADVKAKLAELAKLKEKYQLIVRVDRAELSKNFIRGFDAFALLLKKHPELIGKVKFLAYAYPTRENLKEYRDYRRDIEAKAKSINTTFGNRDWQPIDLSIEDNFNRSVAAMSSFDVLLTNPIYDGMNLVAKEASVLNKHDGVIVLSENAGAYEELRDGVLGVNPFDVEETMNKLWQALTMTPLERGLRANRLREIVERNDVLKWLRHQLRDIKKILKTRAGQDGERVVNQPAELTK